MLKYISLVLIQIAIFTAVLLLSACSLKFEAGYHGQTGRDDRVISPTLYPEGTDQKRQAGQRY